MNFWKSFTAVATLALLIAGVVWLNMQGQTAVSAAAAQTESETAVETDPALSGGTISASFVAGGFSNPVDITNAGDDRLFVVQRGGIIKIIDIDGSVRPTPFLDITSIVNSSPNERGLLGLAFHPDYPDTPYFYVNYTTTGIDGHSSGDTVISRFTVSSDPYIANPASRQEIIAISQPDWNHNGGDLNFGPDGYLYIGMGDGGGGGDTSNYAQNMSALLGKMLRIDVDGGGLAPDCDSNGNYTIPADNPFVDGAGGDCDEIWALGLRNPWRFSFDRQTGDMYIGDVGQGAWEEVNFQPASSTGGENWGWRCYEGTHPYNTNGCDSTYEDPFFEYPHSQGIAVTGGYAYRGNDYPAIDGYYFFADYGYGNFWMAHHDGVDWDVEPLGTLAGPGTPSTFGEGCDGELYVAHYSSSGSIYQIQSVGLRAKPAGSGGGALAYLPIVIGGEGEASTPTPTVTVTSSPTMIPTIAITPTSSPTTIPTIAITPTSSPTTIPTIAITPTSSPTMIPTMTPTPVILGCSG